MHSLAIEHHRDPDPPKSYSQGSQNQAPSFLKTVWQIGLLWLAELLEESTGKLFIKLLAMKFDINVLEAVGIEAIIFC